jgi:GR25 family glycosyltransferase involved in LPS biosynthesis
MECYVINLDRCIKNFYKIRPHLIEQGIVPKRFRGVDASKGEYAQYMNRISKMCQTSCPMGAIGCGLSHILLAQQLWDKGTELALILEDDVYPKVPNVLDQIKETIKNVTPDWSIIKLHCDD